MGEDLASGKPLEGIISLASKKTVFYTFEVGFDSTRSFFILYIIFYTKSRIDKFHLCFT